MFAGSLRIGMRSLEMGQNGRRGGGGNLGFWLLGRAIDSGHRLRIGSEYSTAVQYSTVQYSADVEYRQ